MTITHPLTTTSSISNGVVENKTYLLNSGLPVPVIAYGTGTKWYAGPSGNDRTIDQISRELVDAIKKALYQGFIHIDTAEVYGNEMEVGVALSEFLKETGVPRSDIFITTKVYPGIADVTKAMEDSLKRLGPAVEGYVDLYLIHAPFWDKSKATLQEAWQKMEGLVSAGKTRSIGVSNFRIQDFEEIAKFSRIPPSCNQIEFHPYLQAVELTTYMKQHNIRPAAYGPLTPITFSQIQNNKVKDVVERIAKSKGNGVTEGQVLQAWSLKMGYIVVTTSAKEERMKEYLKVQGVELSDKEVEEICEAGKGQEIRKFWTKEKF
ncbi:hypothetical protein HDU76_004441 [Blyttiomyces sp. JEL0837]|nr:hypothetical protein HDU76_004441 [Blyttiomyces sp. JEL0837]